ncbi:AAA-like domain-containing protein [Oscillatoria acuminata]|uniref:WD40 repeat-containing protein n=1 Tax=Oscillatoria acuminata PCC 6304 TaxID=56110 RepID=K9TNH7_9CYAN|nr:AAA-like domain-containing protein [Oscillatoria acuminata]AFY83701.1 WD40 repeat-containing protein [Oscillatoria acuminata PCC 6304]
MQVSKSSNFSYQVGGSLTFNAPTYVQRPADKTLFQELVKGEFCYVFNARQMGKSSLRVQTTHRLQSIGIRCGVIDVSAIGTQEVTQEQWYGSIVGLLTKAFRLEVNLLSWWRDRTHCSYVNRLSDFLETVLLAQVPEPIVIFIDEIDSVLSLNFSTDDFFALIRACYNRRADNEDYGRLAFALFGVATPADLIFDGTRTPFNIGKGIELSGFEFQETSPLLVGLSEQVADPKLALKRILYWTGGQPFLTQKLCQMISSHSRDNYPELTPDFINSLVEINLIKNWKANDEPEHFKTICDRLLYSEQRVGRLLGLYQKILLHSEEDETSSGFEQIAADDSPEQTELILTGLIEKREGILRIKNPIYQEIFSFEWVATQLANLRPYSQAIDAWIVSGYQDESWLLRGKALRDILDWSQGKSLSNLDYQFLAASQELDRQETQRTLEAERLKEVEARLQLEQRHLKRQNLLLGIVSIAMIVASSLGVFAYQQYQQTAISEIRAITLSSEALFASNKSFNALLQAIKGKERSKQFKNLDSELEISINEALWQVILSIQESNRLNGHTAAVLAVDYSPDGQKIVTAGVDGTLKLWKRDGTLIQTLTGHQAVVRAVKFSPNGELIASSGDDKTVKFWKRDGTLLSSSQANTSGIWSIDFSPDGEQVISGGSDSTVESWNSQGELVTRFEGEPTGIRAVAFSPDGQTVAAGKIDNTIQLWNAEGSKLRELIGHPSPVYAVAFSPDNTLLASGTVDGMINIWTREGTLLHTLKAHDATVKELRFSPDSSILASVSWDKTLKLWKRDGTLISTLRGHDAAIWGMAFSPDGEEIASAGAENVAILWKNHSIFQQKFYALNGLLRGLSFSADGKAIATSGTDKNIRIWQLDGTLLRTIKAHEAALGNIDFHPHQDVIASVSEDKTLKIWQLDGTILQTFEDANAALLSVNWDFNGERLAAGDANGVIWLWSRQEGFIKPLTGHTAPTWSVKFSPDGQILASASNDSTIRLWNRSGQLLNTLNGHNAAVWKVTFSPDGEMIASGSGDMTVKLWRKDGTLIKTLTGHTAAVWGIDFSPDGSLIATSSIDETIKIWTREGVLLTTLTGHHAGVRAVAFHPTLPILVSVGDEQIMMLWHLDRILNLDPLTYACHWVQNYLKTNPSVPDDEAKLCTRRFSETPLK